MARTKKTQDPAGTGSMKETPEEVRAAARGVRKIAQQLGASADASADGGAAPAEGAVVDPVVMQTTEDVIKGLRLADAVAQATGVKADDHEIALLQIRAINGSLQGLAALRAGVGDRGKVMVGVRRMFQTQVRDVVDPRVAQGDTELAQDIGDVDREEAAVQKPRQDRQAGTVAANKADAAEIQAVQSEGHMLRTLAALKDQQPVSLADQLKAAETYKKLQQEGGGGGPTVH